MPNDTERVVTSIVHVVTEANFFKINGLFDALHLVNTTCEAPEGWIVHQSFSGAAEMRCVHRIKPNQSRKKANVGGRQDGAKEKVLIHQAIFEMIHCVEHSVDRFVVFVLSLGFTRAVDRI